VGPRLISSLPEMAPAGTDGVEIDSPAIRRSWGVRTPVHYGMGGASQLPEVSDARNSLRLRSAASMAW
jgi:hypothetical protein